LSSLYTHSLALTSRCASSSFCKSWPRARAPPCPCLRLLSGATHTCYSTYSFGSTSITVMSCHGTVTLAHSCIYIWPPLSHHCIYPTSAYRSHTYALHACRLSPPVLSSVLCVSPPHSSLSSPLRRWTKRWRRTRR
jgi:hypothetical protein